MRKYISILVLVLLMAGCSSKTPSPEPVMDMPLWADMEVLDQQTDFYQSVTVALGKVNTQEKTAVATVVIPDLEKYLISEGDYTGDMCEVEMEFPVEQVEGEWHITSFDPLIDYINNEAEQILFDKIKTMGGIEIYFDPQEVPEK